MFNLKSNSNIFNCKILLLLVFLLTSCSAIERNFNFDSNRYTKTSLGAAAGAAIGATAGTIIGSTSGDAGQGFLLGGGLGAVSGAVIGKEMDVREERAYARSSINSQNYQNQRLDTIRNNSIDGYNSQGSFNQGGLDQGALNQGAYNQGSYNQTSAVQQGYISDSSSSFDSSGRFIIPDQNRPSAAYSDPSSRRYASIKPSQSAYIVESDIGSASLPAGVIASAAPITRTVQPKLIAPIAKAPISRKSRARLKTAKAFVAPKISNRNIPLAKTQPITQVDKAQAIPLAKTFPIDKPAIKSISSVKTNALQQVRTVTQSAATIPSTIPVAKTISTGTTTTQLAGKAVGTCTDAEAEASRARTAATDTDKIFYFRRALRLCKSKPNYHVEIGKVYASIGRKEEAESEFSKALEIDPNNSEAQDELTILMLDGVN